MDEQTRELVGKLKRMVNVSVPGSVAQEAWQALVDGYAAGEKACGECAKATGAGPGIVPVCTAGEGHATKCMNGGYKWFQPKPAPAPEPDDRPPWGRCGEFQLRRCWWGVSHADETSQCYAEAPDAKIRVLCPKARELGLLSGEAEMTCRTCAEWTHCGFDDDPELGTCSRQRDLVALTDCCDRHRPRPKPNDPAPAQTGECALAADECPHLQGIWCEFIVDGGRRRAQCPVIDYLAESTEIDCLQKRKDCPIRTLDVRLEKALSNNRRWRKDAQTATQEREAAEALNAEFEEWAPKQSSLSENVVAWMRAEVTKMQRYDLQSAMLMRQWADRIAAGPPKRPGTEEASATHPPK